MPVCGHPGWADCAHEAARQLHERDIVDLRNKGLYACQQCDYPIRAHQVGDYCSKNYQTVDEADSEGTYLNYQVRDVDGQGHVYITSNGQDYGNGNYDWENNNSKGGNISTTIYKLK